MVKGCVSGFFDATFSHVYLDSRVVTQRLAVAYVVRGRTTRDTGAAPAVKTTSRCCGAYQTEWMLVRARVLLAGVLAEFLNCSRSLINAIPVHQGDIENI